MTNTLFSALLSLYETTTPGAATATPPHSSHGRPERI
jgi:hypothetical protein